MEDFVGTLAKIISVPLIDRDTCPCQRISKWKQSTRSDCNIGTSHFRRSDIAFSLVRDLKVKMFDTDESVKDKYENQMMHQISVDTPRVSKTISIFQLPNVWLLFLSLSLSFFRFN